MSGSTTGSLVSLSPGTVVQYLESQSGLRSGKRRVVLLRAAPSWEGPAQLSWGQRREAAVVAAPSPLAVYELALGHRADSATGPEVLVVLTDREEVELGPDLLARVHKWRVNTVDAWDMVRNLFGVSLTEGRLNEEKWAAEALLDARPGRGWPRLTGGMLSRREALTLLTLRRLGIGRYDPDSDDRSDSGALAGASASSADDVGIQTLLRWSLMPGGPDRLLALRAPEQAGIIRFLGEEAQAGRAGQALLALVRAEHGADAVAFGLVCGALWGHADATADTEDFRARGRAERWFGEEPPAHGRALDELVAAFGRSCEEFIAALLAERSTADSSESTRRLTAPLLERAASLARQFGAERAARTSPVLTAGLEARFTAIGEALLAKELARATAAIRAVGEHRLAQDSEVVLRTERARMALRLSQWLAAGVDAGCEGVAAGIDRHLADTGWVDLALHRIAAGGDSDPVLKSAYDALGGAVRARRHEIDRRFARTLADWTSGGGAPGSMLTVERFLPDVVAPVVRDARRPVLLIVIDGMTAAIAADLGEALREQWVEYDPWPRAKGTPRRRGMAAALPTVTAVSRTSLFAAELRRGTQVDEKKLFPGHEFWGGEQVAVFHKDDLRAVSDGDEFGPALEEALSGERTHVAVVLNTVDDRLASEHKDGDGGAWRPADIGKLPELLHRAASTGRTVIITSDHGHVVDRRGQRVDAVDMLSARHRAPGGSLAEEEITLSGPRVVDPRPGGEIVALWDTDSRYSARRAGYHGGAAPAEVAIPVLALLPFGAEAPKGWLELGSQQPSWWTLTQRDGSAAASAQLPATTAGGPVRRKTGRRSKKDVQLAGNHDSLFEVRLIPTGEAGVSGEAALLSPALVSPDDALVSALLASQVLVEQQALLPRKPTSAQLEKSVRALLEAGGTLPVTALAQRIGLPAQRADGFGALLRQLVNRDSVQVLELLADGRTLRLNVGLLREQFELG
ncbi:BREX-2 system phosphatase PglZ [Streptomyces xiamenensis]|uniref:BREX-2 system phosphatase PglZ n=1 Tax=Streptomyces xiamenensis TaxID=408015 RepID=UPI0037D05F8F